MSSQATEQPRAGDRGIEGRLYWVFPGVMLVAMLFLLITGQRREALTAGLGLLLTLVPVIIVWTGNWRVPNEIALTFALAITIQYLSEALGIFRLINFWDQVVHFLQGLLWTALIAFLLLGYREVRNLNFHVKLAVTSAILWGIALAAIWEIVEFTMDHLLNTNLQLSNFDTMTDLIVDTGGAIVGGLVGLWIFEAHASRAERMQLGRIAIWLTDHLLRGVVVAAAIMAILGAAWVLIWVPLPI